MTCLAYRCPPQASLGLAYVRGASGGVCEAFSELPMSWRDQCEHCGLPDHECYQVRCARCGKNGWSDEFIIEEGDEWECPSCNERENARERAELGK